MYLGNFGRLMQIQKYREVSEKHDLVSAVSIMPPILTHSFLIYTRIVFLTEYSFYLYLVFTMSTNLLPQYLLNPLLLSSNLSSCTWLPHLQTLIQCI